VASNSTGRLFGETYALAWDLGMMISISSTGSRLANPPAGLAAAHEAGLPLRLSLIVARHNAHEVDQMVALAQRLGVPHHVFTNMSPTIYGGADSLPAQSVEHLRRRKPFTGCNAGHTFFHVDPHGRASIRKVGRDPRRSS
jgi:MoaA/NifB/PqqE/SkfB family radical SAM enzyme